MSCFAVLSLSYIPDDNASKQTELARASTFSSFSYSSVVEPSFSIFCFRGPFLILYRYTAAIVCTWYEFIVLEHLQQYREHSSTAQRNHPCTKQQTKYVPIRVDQKKYVRICMQAASGLFSWSMELLEFVSRLFAPKMSDHLHLMPFRSLWLFVICTSMLSLSIYISTASTAQQSTKQQAKYVPIRVHVKRSTWYVRTCMQRPGCVPGAWNSRHLQVACVHPKCWTIYMCHSVPFFPVSERSGRSRLFAPKMLDHLLHRSFRSILPCERA